MKGLVFTSSSNGKKHYSSAYVLWQSLGEGKIQGASERSSWSVRVRVSIRVSVRVTLG